MISEYKFGKMIVDGNAYFHDLILTPGGVIPDWWRKESHRLDIEDIRSVLDTQQPEILVVGTGKFGLMKIPAETRAWLKSKGIELVAERTTQAVHRYNHLVQSRKVVGAFHLTC